MRRLAVAVAALALGGCASDYRLDFTLLDTPPAEAHVQLDSFQVLLQDGIAVAVLARPLEDDDKMDWETVLDLKSSDIRTFEINRLVYDETAEARKDSDIRDGDWQFLLWGRRPGQATLEMWIDGELEGTVNVQVDPQSE